MDWLHTWAGVVLGALLFAIFWMGTLAVFDREIDRWMAPMTRLAVPTQTISFDTLRPSLELAAKAGAPTWAAILPSDRQPAIRVSYRDGSGAVTRYLDPSSGAVLPDLGTWAGTQFIYPFHIHLHVQLWNVGIWLVGIAGMAMLALCVSGVIIHRKIFADFFTFRPRKQSHRMLLDLHNVSGVLGLPFHIAITLSGLIIFQGTYFPSDWQKAYLGRQAASAEPAANYARPKLNRPGEIGSLDAMASVARGLWSGAEPWAVVVRHPGDAASYVQFNRGFRDRVAISSDVAYFDVATGALLHQRSDPKPVMSTQRFIAGFHLVQFRHWTLRWIYFALGLAGCVMIATGYLFWLESRRKKHQQLGLSGVRIVEGLTIGSTVGIIVATLAFFVANRLLPLGTTGFGYERAALEAGVFYLVWLATFGHAWLRPKPAWTEQCWTMAILAVAAVALNGITTGDHLGRSLVHPYLWPVAGIDLMLLAVALVAALAARKLQLRAAMPQSGSALAAELSAAE